MLKDKIKNTFSNKTFTSKEAGLHGVSARMLSHLVRTGEIERLGRGIYCCKGFEPSGDDWQFHDLATVARSYKDAVICLVSALSYWELTEEFARSFWLAFPNNHPPVKNPRVKMYRPRNLELGVMTIELAGSRVRITDPERSVVDAFRYLDEESAVTSLRMYLDQDDAKLNVGKLVDYAVELRETKLLGILTGIAAAQARSYPSLKDKAFKQTIKAISKRRSKD